MQLLKKKKKKLFRQFFIFSIKVVSYFFPFKIVN